MPMTSPCFAFLETIEPEVPSPLLLLADHAGNRIPPELGDLGLSPLVLQRHIAFDIGAAEVTRELAVRLGATAILSHCSRLVADPNRRPDTPTCIPEVSDATVIPGNVGLDATERRRRINTYHLPYHRAVARAAARIRRRGTVPVVIAIHSFTPRLDGGPLRPWQIGVLHRQDRRLADPVLAALRARADLAVGDNEPYSGELEFGYTVELHAQRARLPHVMLEIRQDEIATVEGAEHYAAIIATALEGALAALMPLLPWAGPLSPGAPWRQPRGLVAPS